MLYCPYVMVSECRYVTDAMMSLCKGRKVVAMYPMLWFLYVNDAMLPLCNGCCGVVM